MGCNTSVSEIRLEAAFASWGIKQIDCISPIPDVTSSLNSTYFLFSSHTVDYYVWNNVGAAGVDPAIAGKTGIEVAFAADSDIATIIAAIKLAIETAVAGYVTVSDDGLSFELERASVGVVLSATADVDTGYTFEILKAGVGGYLGRTSEGIEVTKEISQFEVKSNQTGETLLDSIKTGTMLTAAMSLLEMTKDRWATLVGGGVGDNFTPAGGTEFTGYGTSKDYTSMLAVSGELELKPVSAVDDSRNFTIWKCLPVPTSINYSGTDLQVMAIEFKGFIDESKDSKVNIGGYGDNRQDFR